MWQMTPDVFKDRLTHLGKISGIYLETRICPGRQFLGFGQPQALSTFRTAGRDPAFFT